MTNICQISLLLPSLDSKLISIAHFFPAIKVNIFSGQVFFLVFQSRNLHLYSFHCQCQDWWCPFQNISWGQHSRGEFIEISFFIAITICKWWTHSYNEWYQNGDRGTITVLPIVTVIVMPVLVWLARTSVNIKAIIFEWVTNEYKNITRFASNGTGRVCPALKCLWRPAITLLRQNGSDIGNWNPSLESQATWRQSRFTIHR